ncbi:hypothetical protein [Rose yellow vein virus]|uniref:Uncharacterized protein n=1 Tax=Rose yellow vein virus TaxID=1213588 RepID=I7E3F7_9VIRU|nr:hypothetical protein [Rose yellow vein virus]AFO83468.1 hypothetical protein [Rose yellow vein virus]
MFANCLNFLREIKQVLSLLLQLSKKALFMSQLVFLTRLIVDLIYVSNNHFKPPLRANPRVPTEIHQRNNSNEYPDSDIDWSTISLN